MCRAPFSRSKAARSSRIARKDKNGYTAVQVGSGKAKVKNVSKAERGRFADRRRSSRR